jgi:hypothetical protein
LSPENGGRKTALLSKDGIARGNVVRLINWPKTTALACSAFVAPFTRYLAWERKKSNLGDEPSSNDDSKS